jgi:hypothetical protein
MSLTDIDESRDINHQREVIKDTSAMVFAGTVISTLVPARHLNN